MRVYYYCYHHHPLGSTRLQPGRQRKGRLPLERYAPSASLATVACPLVVCDFRGLEVVDTGSAQLFFYSSSGRVIVNPQETRVWLGLSLFLWSSGLGSPICMEAKAEIILLVLKQAAVSLVPLCRRRPSLKHLSRERVGFNARAIMRSGPIACSDESRCIQTAVFASVLGRGAVRALLLPQTRMRPGGAC